MTATSSLPCSHAEIDTRLVRNRRGGRAIGHSSALERHGDVHDCQHDHQQHDTIDAASNNIGSTFNVFDITPGWR